MVVEGSYNSSKCVMYTQVKGVPHHTANRTHIAQDKVAMSCYSFKKESKKQDANCFKIDIPWRALGLCFLLFNQRKWRKFGRGGGDHSDRPLDTCRVYVCVISYLYPAACRDPNGSRQRPPSFLQNFLQSRPRPG